VVAACGGEGASTDVDATAEATAEEVETTEPVEEVTTEATPEATEEPTEAATTEPEPTATEATEAAAASAAPTASAAPAGGTAVEGTEGAVGDTLTHTTDEGEEMQYAVLEVVDPATDVVSAANYEVREGQRFVFVRARFTWVAGDYANAFIYPGINDAVVDDRGAEIPHVIAVVDECQPFEDEELQPGQTIEGCFIYEVAEAAPLTAFRWYPVPGAEPLSWTIGG
jgi:hypothetical protein